MDRYRHENKAIKLGGIRFHRSSYDPSRQWGAKHNINAFAQDEPTLSWNDVRDEFSEDPGAVADLRAAVAPTPMSEIVYLTTPISTAGWLERMKNHVSIPGHLYAVGYEVERGE